MKKFMLTCLVMLSLIGGTTNELQAQPEFATVRLVTSWGNNTSLFITRGQEATEQMDLSQRLTDKKHDKEIDKDNKIINSVFEVLYGEGFELVSTSARNHPGGGFISAGSEVIYLLVKE